MNVGYDWKNQKKNFGREKIDLVKKTIYSIIDNEIRDKDRNKFNYNDSKTSKKDEAGFNWFNQGFSLEDAPDELRDDISFITGFERAKRVDNINRDLIAIGEDYYLRGVPLEEVPKIYQRNEFFLQGYNNNLNKKR